MIEEYPLPSKGKIVISKPYLYDIFKRSVIYLTEHNEEGSIGFIINKPLNIYVNKLINNFPYFESKVYLGGPVQPNTIHFIHTVGDLLEGSLEISDGIYWGGSFECLKILIEEKKVNSEDFKFFVGYSGWSANQLQEEIKSETWIVSSVNKEILFNSDDQKVWQDILKNLGKNYHIMANFPEDPSLN